MKEYKLLWHDMLNIYMWHRYPKEALVTDEIAWIALCRLDEWIKYALSALEDESSNAVSEE